VILPRWFRLRLLSCLLLCLAAHSGAEPADRTDEAFGALLAMPGAQPVEGGWIIPHEPARDETDLIAKWQGLKRAGADFNAMRHRGTLLAHAIRAGRERAAIWLLANGADARKMLAETRADAYELARQYKRASVLRVLEAQYGFKPAAAPAPAAAAASAVASAAAPQTRVQQAQAELQRLVGRFLQRDEAAQQAWRRYAATLSADEFQALFKDGPHMQELVLLTRDVDGALDEALGRLPQPLVRDHAQAIADMLAESSRVTYGLDPQRIVYTSASRSWPALWKRFEGPLRYDTLPDLAGRIPPALWPGLFASGYAQQDAELTGCLLAAVDLPGLKALWPDFRRLFPNALAAAPGLVLGAWRLTHEASPCNYSSLPAETAAKLAFLRSQGATAPVEGLRQPDPAELLPPALAEMLAAFTPPVRPPPRLLAAAPNCELVPADAWLNVLARLRMVGWGTPADNVAAVEVPGQGSCALLVSGSDYPDWSRTSDNFETGPFRDPPVANCADAPDDAEIWLPGTEGLRRVEVGTETRGIGLASLHLVRDVQTGQRHWLTDGQVGALCSRSNQLPHAFEWQPGQVLPRLVPSRESPRLDGLLRRQCQRAGGHRDVSCPGLYLPEPPKDTPLLDRLRLGATVPLQALLDHIGAERRAAYRAALAAHAHAQLRGLLARGIPPAWTASEIRTLATADLPLPEKRRRIALLFANAEQLSLALEAGGEELATALAGWLPRQDWGPVLRIVAKAPDTWYDFARALRAAAAEDVACNVDRAQGFLCGGGLSVE
jgi:hypothetical protein